jgi:hypothetical protein
LGLFLPAGLRTVASTLCASKQVLINMAPGKIHFKPGPVVWLCGLVGVYLVLVYRGWVRGKEKDGENTWENSPLWQEDEKSHK